MDGTVKRFNAKKGYGFISPDGGGEDIFVHLTAVKRAGLSTLTEGQRVRFRLAEHDGRPIADDLEGIVTVEEAEEEEYLTDELLEADAATVSVELVREVSSWKLEARSENNDRYFFHSREVSRIEGGDKCYVIGRKGSGKTAISEYLGRISAHDTFSEKLTFKNFPFNELYSLSNNKYTNPNQYITLWKYLIYSSICRMMAKNATIDAGVSKILHEQYGADATSLSRKVSRWVGKEFSLTLFGSHFGSAPGKYPRQQPRELDRPSEYT